MKQNNHLMKRFALYFRMSFRVGALSSCHGAASFLLGAVLLTTVAAIAQEKPQGLSPKDTASPVIRLSRAQLMGYEGYYRNPENDEAIVRVILVNDTLRIRPVWNTVDFPIIPASDTLFFNPEPAEGRRQEIGFIKDRQGFVRKLSTGPNFFWSKLANYTPIERKEMTHTADQLKAFEGVYGSTTNGSAFVWLSERDNKLFLRQFWNDEEVIFVPDSSLHFFSREERLLFLTFSREDDGSIRKMQAYNKENWEKVKATVISRSLLNGYEGRYRLKEDPDDVIQVTATDSALVVKELWDGRQLVFKPLAEFFFYSKEQSSTLHFKKKKDGTLVLNLNTEELEKIKE
jgi:hypothetical protein